jgi:hypothetical protein
MYIHIHIHIYTYIYLETSCDDVITCFSICVYIPWVNGSDHLHQRLQSCYTVTVTVTVTVTMIVANCLGGSHKTDDTVSLCERACTSVFMHLQARTATCSSRETIKFMGNFWIACVPWLLLLLQEAWKWRALDAALLF